MAKIKKTFDRDSMYKKIMPTTVKKDIEQKQEETNTEIHNTQSDTSEVQKERHFFQNKELHVVKEQKDEVILYNITEKLVLDKLDATLKKMNCCRCDRCKEDIVAVALNNLKPMYIVASKDQIKEKIRSLNEKSNEVTTEVIKAVLMVRKNPRH